MSHQLHTSLKGDKAYFTGRWSDAAKSSNLSRQKLSSSLPFTKFIFNLIPNDQVMTWMSIDEHQTVPKLQAGDRCVIEKAALSDRRTSPPDYLTGK